MPKEDKWKTGDVSQPGCTLGGAFLFMELILNTLAGVAAFVFLVIALVTLAWPFIMTRVWPYLLIPNKSFLGHLLAAAVFVILGIVLYVIRIFYRAVYGVAETAVGASMCWVAIGSPQVDSTAFGLVLASGVYVIVRGLDNFFEGLKTKSLLGRFVERQRKTLKQFDEEIHHHAHTHHDPDKE